MIKNKSKNKILVNNITHCNSLMSKTKGLMFSKKIVDRGLIFYMGKEKKVDLHMFFVFFPIDILWLDSKKRVVQIKEGAKPFNPLIVSRCLSKYVIELPFGAIRKTSTKEGDEIYFIEHIIGGD